MTWYEWIFAIAASWLVVAIAVAALFSVALRREIVRFVARAGTTTKVW